MIRRNRIAKIVAEQRLKRDRIAGARTAQRLKEYEIHLQSLCTAYWRDDEEPERFGQIAAELLVLVCETPTNKPLLFDLMDEYGLTYYPRLAKTSSPEDPAPRVRVDFRDYIANLPAGSIQQREYNYRDLILATARQFSRSHADDIVDDRVLQLQRHISGTNTDALNALRGLASFVIHVGAGFIEELVRDRDYKPVRIFPVIHRKQHAADGFGFQKGNA